MNDEYYCPLDCKRLRYGVLGGLCCKLPNGNLRVLKKETDGAKNGFPIRSTRDCDYTNKTDLTD